MNSFPEEFEELVKRFSEFPGVGRRSAERIVFHILKMEKNKVQALSQLILRKLVNVLNHARFVIIFLLRISVLSAETLKETGELFVL